MGTLKDAVDRVVSAKGRINQAIIDKGGTVNPGDGLVDAATNIGTIPGPPPPAFPGAVQSSATVKLDGETYPVIHPYGNVAATSANMTANITNGANLIVKSDGVLKRGAYRISGTGYMPSSSTALGGADYVVVPGTSDKSIGTTSAPVWLAHGFKVKGDANLKAGNIKKGVAIFNVAGTAPNPAGNIDITTTGSVDVTNYATAKVVDANLKADNIKKGVSILGVSGAMESGGGGGGGGGLAPSGHTLSLYCTGSNGLRNVFVVHPDGTSSLYGAEYSINNVYAYAAWADSTPSVGVLTEDSEVAVSSGCLLRGTMVTLSDGSTKPIEDLTYDDELLVWDFDAGRQSAAKPFWLKKAERTDHYWVNTFASGRVVKTTGTVAGHRFFDLDTQRFEYNTDCVGHRVETLDGPDVLVSAERVDEECEFYNLNTERHINCYAGGVLASCRLNNLYRIEDMRFVESPVARHRRAEFPGVPDYWIDGGRFLEQPLSTGELAEYALEREEIRK